MTGFDTALILDRIDEGIILLDAEQKILAFNEKAKEITGITLSGDMRHDAGKINTGDLVLFISAPLGEDDGGLTPELLSHLGIRAEDIRMGDVVMGIGLYNVREIEGRFSRMPFSEISDNRSISGEFLGNEWHLEIEVSKRRMKIIVNDMIFEQHFVNAYGHMVVLDGDTGNLKFYQDRGYSVRHEAIADLLRGGTFAGKGSKESQLIIEDRSLHEILSSDQLYDTLHTLSEEAKSLQFRKLPLQRKLYLEINRRPVYCEVSHLIDAFLIKFRDLSEMETLLVEYEAILENASLLHANTRLVKMPEALEQFDAFIGQSDAVHEVKFMAHRAAQIKSNVLITGESGTGKTLLAKLIHKNSRQNGAFVEVNCAAIPSALFESELFGYERGAFTGADEKGKKGFFELADGGTLFLDEIGELPLDIQVKLLQALQSKRFYKIGAKTPTKVNTRIITATNKSLSEAVALKQFREDLYYRVNVFPIALPALRDRQMDLYLLTRQTIQRIALEMEMPEKRLSGDAYAWIRQHHWPGNIRELENVLERAMAISTDDIIDIHHLKMTGGLAQQITGGTLKTQLLSFERQILIEAMMRYGNQQEVMRNLGLSKSTFYDKIKKHGIDLSVQNMTL